MNFWRNDVRSDSKGKYTMKGSKLKEREMYEIENVDDNDKERLLALNLASYRRIRWQLDSHLCVMGI